MMEGTKHPGMGVLLASGLAAGVFAYVMARRNSRQESMQASAMERVRGLSDLEATRVGREYLTSKVIPEMKPVLLDLLKDVEDYVNHYFKRAEKAVKAM